MEFTWIPAPLAKFFRILGKTLSKSQFRNLRLLLLGIMVGHGRTDMTALTELLRKKHISRTRFGKFLNRSPWNPEDQLKTTAEVLLRCAFAKHPKTKRIYFIIDSSLLERTSLNVSGSQRLKKTSGGYTKGQTAVVAILRVEDISIPYAIELCLSKTWAKALKRPHRTQHQIAIDMIRSFTPPDGIEVFTLFDSFFGSRDLLNACVDKGFTFVTNLKANRLVRAHRPERQVGGWARNVLSHTNEGLKVGRQTFFVAYRRSFLPNVGRVFLTFSRKPGHKRIFHLATNAFLSPQEMVAAYLKRWSIECFFKDVKHHLGWGRYPARRQKGATAHLHLILMTHALLTYLRIQDGETGKTRKTKSASSIAEVRSDLRTRQQAHHLLRTAKRLKMPANFDQIWKSQRLVS